MIIAIVGVGLYMTVGDKVFAFMEKVEAFKQSLMTFKTLWIILIILSPFILYINYKLYRKIIDKFSEIKERKLEIETYIKEINRLLKTDLKWIGREELKQIYREIKEKLELTKKVRRLRKFSQDLAEKRGNARRAFLRIRREETLNEFENKKSKLQEEIKELDEEKEDRILELENKNWSILCRMDADRTEAFPRKELTQEQIEALHAYDWEDANEYDVMEKKSIPVLVKKIMNHSKTHTFLVWSVKRLLESLGIRAEKHDTKYPDVTFFHNDEWWAIEIEKGSLLRKRNQMRKKVDFLNRRFPNRWMFVVSNKDLLPQYREWGPATPRSGVEKTIKNWLNSSI